MKVSYLFSNRKKIGSRLIAWASKYEGLNLPENPSHAAVLLNDTIVIESILTEGVRMVPYKAWLKINHEVARLECIKTHRESEEVLSHVIGLWGKSYDWRGILYFGLAYLKLIILKKPLPKHNLWQQDSSYFCTEYQTLLTGVGDAMTSPAKMLYLLKKKGLTSKN